MASKSQSYHGLVDMGSNGIRFSITDLSPSSARLLPTIYQSRTAISLYDAQYSSSSGERSAIPDHVTDDVVSSLLRFKSVCSSFGVPDSQIRIIATEATRTAPNSAEFRAKLEQASGWKVEMLAKEDEGKVGAFGVVSGFADVKGLVMDLGGGSTQSTWVESKEGDVQIGEEGSISLPYGAAALMQRLNSADGSEDSLRTEMHERLSTAITSLNLSSRVSNDEKLNLYLSGGGFRGWGYVLMSRHEVQPYPIPIINGFSESAQNVAPEKVASEGAITSSIFRISNRRASQSDAVALLISVLIDLLPQIGTVSFAQGGVREGVFFQQLPVQVRAIHPIEAATAPFKCPDAEKLAGFLLRTIPQPDTRYGDEHVDVDVPVSKHHLIALANLLHHHAPCPKDIRASAALRCTTTGILASAHGLNHFDRAIVALMLFSRWEGNGACPPCDEQFLNSLIALVGEEAAWWVELFGVFAQAIGDRFPAGVVDESQGRKWGLDARWGKGETKNGKFRRLLVLEVKAPHSGRTFPAEMQGWIKRAEKLGKGRAKDGDVGYKVAAVRI